jgi:hypothetical protein
VDNLPVVVAEGEGGGRAGVGGGNWSLSGRKQKYQGPLPVKSLHGKYSMFI